MLHSIETVKTLVWEPDLTTRAVIARALYVRGHDVTTFAASADAFAAWQRDRHQLVIAGWYDDGRTLELCQNIRESTDGADVVLVVAGSGISEDALARITRDADDVMGIEPDELAKRIRIAEHHVAEAERRRAAQEALAHQALHDALTDLPNRALLLDRLRQSLRTAQRQGHTVAVLVIDLDRFKAVNDTFGHQAGDMVLQEAANRLRSGVRASDTMARIGGDEFAAVLPMIGEMDSALATARKLLEVLVDPYVVDAQVVEIGASIGLAMFPPHGEEEQVLLRWADAAMYAAKRGGGGLLVASRELLDSPMGTRTPFDPLPPADAAPPAPAEQEPRSQAELLRTLGQDLDHDGQLARAIIAEDDGYRLRVDGTEVWRPLEELIRESISRALRRQAH